LGLREKTQKARDKYNQLTLSPVVSFVPLVRDKYNKDGSELAKVFYLPDLADAFLANHDFGTAHRY
jgi:hypothetical protein